MAVSPDGALVIATSEGASTVHFIDAATGALLGSVLVGSRPRAALFLEGGRRLWVTSELRGTISIFDPATRKKLETIDLVQQLPSIDPVQAVELAATRDGKRIFVALGRGNHVAEIDPATHTVVRTFPVGDRNWGIALSPDEKRLYAVAGLSGDMTVIDLIANRVARTIKLGGRPWGVVATP
jgi:YVTN family beta-propeller protein